jgi:lipopolysaccharide export system permease protein
MKTLEKYMFKETLRTLFPVWIFLGILIYLLETMSGALAIRDEFGKIAALYLYKIPKNLEMMFPVAALFSVLNVLGGMNRAHELVAARSMGFRNLNLLRPLLLAASLGAVCHYYVSNTWAPLGLRHYWEKWDLEIRGRETVRTTRIKKSKIWFRNQNVLYNVGYWNPELKEIYDITIYTFDQNFHIAQVIEAARAHWEQDRWIMQHGLVRLTDKTLLVPITQSFEVRETKLLDKPDDLQVFDFKVEILNQEDLGALIKRSQRMGIPTSQWNTLYHSRVSFTIVAFILILLAFPRITRFHRGKGAAGDFLFVGAICFGYWVVFHYALSLGGYGRVPPLLAAWLPNFLAAGLAVFYFGYQTLEKSSD